MKIIELNIGLNSKTQGTLNPNEILNALTGRGFTLIKYRVQESQCKDGIEKCLAVKAECPADWQTQLASLSDKLGQDCIALCGFVGHSPYDAFCAELWAAPVAVQLSECQAIQAEHAKRLALVDGWESPEQFTAYLEGALIPDLKESGMEATASDFETAVKFIRRK